MNNEKKVSNVLCERCEQRQAVITISKNNNGEQAIHHYCEKCAQNFYPFTNEMPKEPISIQQLLANWQTPKNIRKEQLRCEGCGYTYAHFRKTGRFGCATCYDTFAEQMPKILQPIQADLQHVGAMPTMLENKKAMQNEVASLRQQMQEAVVSESFEQAALLRDAIKELEAKVEEGEANE